MGSEHAQRPGEPALVVKLGEYDGDKQAEQESLPVEGLRKSDTADSLSSLVARTQNLNHIGNIDSLPSPVAGHNDIWTSLPKRSKSPVKEIQFSSPLRTNISLPFDPRMESPDMARLPRFDDRKALPHALFRRLQEETQRNNRHTSLSVPQSLANMEMPPLIRHRSQSEVNNHQEDVKLHRATDTAPDSREVALSKVGHSITAADNDERFQITIDGVRKEFLGLDLLGEGTFSQVVLARNIKDKTDFVAVKTVEFPDRRGQRDEGRIELTVRREIELLERLRHPLIVSLHGWSAEREVAHVFLEYCPGGDLFSLAANHSSLMTVSLVRRIFAEVLQAVRFIHRNHVVHRDLKLENVLLRLSSYQLSSSAIETKLLTKLTDFGLARPFDPALPELTTRCGSEDYTAPEIIMGQPYDGRQTDAWALGVLLYSLMEGRLPFDVIPGLEHKMKSKVLHRVCRIEWRWVARKEPGTYDPAWDGAKRIVSNLLRSRAKRWTLDMVAEDEWVQAELKVVDALLQAQSSAQ